MPDSLGCDNENSSLIVNVDALGLDLGGLTGYAGKSGKVYGCNVVSVPVEYSDNVDLGCVENTVDTCGALSRK